MLGELIVSLSGDWNRVKHKVTSGDCYAGESGGKISFICPKYEEVCHCNSASLLGLEPNRGADRAVFEGAMVHVISVFVEIAFSLFSCLSGTK